ncbi:hypothetical protein CHS0354_002179 [Potamilus streckersoni]|uniref:Uncharacterized protein n=1 Tax=Potamilus streckersoni TaxID=2493646 RepID=A0AAE0RS36_9BIVA|nr:hypothetical protein CHS0354_002179 [Potamilus streckersoni]
MSASQVVAKYDDVFITDVILRNSDILDKAFASVVRNNVLITFEFTAMITIGMRACKLNFLSERNSLRDYPATSMIPKIECCAGRVHHADT